MNNSSRLLTAHRSTDGATLLAQDKAERVTTALALSELGTCVGWGGHLARSLAAGSRLLVAGNGGSAAQAQHLSAELVGRYLAERRPFSAIALHADTSSYTAICNDYGPEEVFARQVEAHGRAGDVLLLLSTSGSSANILAAADRGNRLGLTVWALTGPSPNPLASLAHQTVDVPAEDCATIQEVHMVAVHLMCEAMENALAAAAGGRTGVADGAEPDRAGDRTGGRAGDRAAGAGRAKEAA